MMIGKEAPGFALTSMDGQPVLRKSFKGKPLVINFWATWCTPCLMEQAAFLQAQKHYAGQVQFLGVVYMDTKEAVEQFVREFGDPFLVAFDKNSRMAIDYGVGGIPETFFVDAQGTIRRKFRGALTLKQLRKDLDPLVEESGKENFRR